MTPKPDETPDTSTKEQGIVLPPAAIAIPANLIRLFSLIPIISTFLASFGLMVFGGIESFNFVVSLFSASDETHAPAHNSTLFHAIELVDLFLLATVIQVVSLGFYQLYFNQGASVPDWLRISSLDDLKSS